MKTKKKILAFVIFAVTALSVLVSCGKGGSTPPANAGDTFTVVVAGEVIAEYTVALDKISGDNGFISVLDYLEEIDVLDYELDGTMLTKVGELENDAASGEWIYLYTTVESDIDVSQYAMTVEYGGKSITSAGIGAQDMTIEKDAIIYVGLIVYE